VNVTNPPVRAQAPAATSATIRPSNLFDLLRLLAAALVVIGHAWPLSGQSGVPEWAGIRIHHLGVYIFFAISGYLLATSWARDPHAAPFLVRRVFRIFPALIAVVVITTVALGPLFTALSASRYWADGQTWTYLINVSLFAQYELPGVFTDHPQKAVNGSLWSLGVEFTCYLVLVVAGLLGARASRVARALIAMAIATTTVAVPLEGPLRITAIAVVFFFLGSLLARGGVSRSLPIWPGMILAIVIAPLAGNVGTVAAWVVVTYLVVALGSRPSRVAEFVRRGGDPSYGMYLWGFPIQQSVIAVFGTLPILSSIGIVLPLTVAFGYLSWHLIEKRAIRHGAAISHRLSTRGARAAATVHSDPST
jgi:peptidoglycan/LPS O-acetylase OafA/YrhL